ncbi:MAG TPA: hypothetical protein PKE63_07930 [Lacibacter sp.]|nr:hypothetical protein [Lacibacter sp.]HMO89361.1 hypothetical protein [Lacibacter sp.]HMP87194.1 hypothetical protein [Lacibacter sp.]
MPQESGAAVPEIKGRFQRKMLWLVWEPDAPFLPDADFEFLTQVLGACRMTWEDAGLINCHGTPPPTAWLDALQPETVICCGLPDGLFPFTASLYQVTPAGNMQFLVTDNLQTVRADKNLKSGLWQGLKKMLDI